MTPDRLLYNMAMASLVKQAAGYGEGLTAQDWAQLGPRPQAQAAPVYQDMGNIWDTIMRRGGQDSLAAASRLASPGMGIPAIPRGLWPDAALPYGQQPLDNDPQVKALHDNAGPALEAAQALNSRVGASRLPR